MAKDTKNLLDYITTEIISQPPVMVPRASMLERQDVESVESETLRLRVELLKRGGRIQT